MNILVYGWSKGKLQWRLIVNIKADDAYSSYCSTD
jgi:hypothetical protein